MLLVLPIPQLAQVTRAPILLHISRMDQFVRILGVGSSGNLLMMTLGGARR
jgi:hypothetical protein